MMKSYVMRCITNEGIKKNIYYELRNNQVLVEKTKDSINYTFGCYRIYFYYDCMVIGKLDKKTGAFVHMNEFWWDDDFPNNNDTYTIYLAAKNKAEGKEYTDPYKNIPVDVAIKDSSDKFSKVMQNTAGYFLPYDMSKQQYTRTVNAMKRLLEQSIKRHYAKQKS